MKRTSNKMPGALTMLGGFVLLGTVPPLVRAARDLQICSAELVFVRFLGASIFVLLLSRGRRSALATQQPRLLLLRGFLGACAVQLYFLAIQHAGAGTGTLLNYTYPLWANLLGFFFGERPSPRFWPLLALALVGVFLVVSPQHGGLGLGEAAGLASALLAGGAVLTIKRLRRTDGELVIVGSFSLLGLLVAGPVCLLMPEEQELLSFQLLPGAYLLALGVAVLSFLGQLYFTRGYKGTSLQLGTVLSLTVPLIATLLGVLLLGEQLSFSFLLGGSLILVACAGVGVIKN